VVGSVEQQGVPVASPVGVAGGLGGPRGQRGSVRGQQRLGQIAQPLLEQRSGAQGVARGQRVAPRHARRQRRRRLRQRRSRHGQPKQPWRGKSHTNETNKKTDDTFGAASALGEDLAGQEVKQGGARVGGSLCGGQLGQREGQQSRRTPGRRSDGFSRLGLEGRLARRPSSARGAGKTLLALQHPQHRAARTRLPPTRRTLRSSRGKKTRKRKDRSEVTLRKADESEERAQAGHTATVLSGMPGKASLPRSVVARRRSFADSRF
jgi:hypothetical protein